GGGPGLQSERARPGGAGRSGGRRRAAGRAGALIAMAASAACRSGLGNPGFAPTAGMVPGAPAVVRPQPSTGAAGPGSAARPAPGLRPPCHGTAMTKTPSLHSDVLIVGGGMAGGLLALLLADQGLTVRVLDGAAEPVWPEGAPALRVSTLNEASY